MITVIPMEQEIKRINDRVTEAIRKGDDPYMARQYEFDWRSGSNRYYEVGPDGMFNHLPHIVYALQSNRPFYSLTDELLDGFWRIVNDPQRELYVVIDTWKRSVLCKVDIIEFAKELCIDYDPSTENWLYMHPESELCEMIDSEEGQVVGRSILIPARLGTPRKPNWQKMAVAS